MSEEAMWTALIKTSAGAAWGWFSKTILRRKPLPIEEIKKRTQVLFVDNESLDSLMNGIRDAGWNCRQITEIKNLDNEEVRGADIVFVDYKDVGQSLTPTEEGIGLVKVLKRKYPEKHIIFFSGYAGFIPGHEVYDYADGWIQKNSDTYVYVEHIDAAAKKKYARG